jgi:exodeoxyribonuclease VII large subunit
MNKSELILSPTDFIVIANQTLEHVFGNVCVEGELSNFKISKNRWVYFDLKDDISKVSCFGSVYSMPGPLKEGMLVKVYGQPRFHQQFGFKLNFTSITPSGEGSIKKAYELLKLKLEAEGLFLDTRKRYIPYPPSKIGLITSIESAAYADFIKIVSIRWPMIKIEMYDVQVQGDVAVAQIIGAVDMANKSANLADALIITRGGGSLDDLSVFNDERLVRAVAASRIPTLVAIGHELDKSLCEMVSDKMASTPSNAAELLVPDRKNELDFLAQQKNNLISNLRSLINNEILQLSNFKASIHESVIRIQSLEEFRLVNYKKLVSALNPQNILKRGYAILKISGKIIKSAKGIEENQSVEITLYDSKLSATINKVELN